METCYCSMKFRANVYTNTQSTKFIFKRCLSKALFFTIEFAKETFLYFLLLKIYFFFLLILKCIFFKLFFSPHFDYCSSLFVYFSNTLLNKLYKLYNLCLYILLRLELNHLSIEAQQDILKPLEIMPFKYRLFL